MTAKRLRAPHTAEELAALYPEPHDHFLYGRGHGERVDATVRLARQAIEWPFLPAQVADLSCGNGFIARSIASVGDQLHLGDLAGVHDMVVGENGYLGAIEETIHLLPEVEVFVCSETIEHLDDPPTVLALIRSKARQLVLSTPLEAWEDTNTEHYWAWDREWVEDLLMRTGWSPVAFTSVDSREYGEPYLYGIWVCS